MRLGKVPGVFQAELVAGGSVEASDENVWNQAMASVRFAMTSWQYAWSVASPRARLVGTRRHKLFQHFHIHEQEHFRHARCIMMTPSPHGPALPGSASAQETERDEGDEASSMNTKVFVLLMATAGAVGLVECGCPAGLFPASGKVPEKGEPAFAQTRSPRSFKSTDEAPEPV
jgi:hypothetical protein